MSDKKILLIHPAYRNQLIYLTEVGGSVVHDFVPLGLATIAALTPDSYHVDIWDEMVHGPIDEQTSFECEYDLVGFSTYGAHIARCRQVASIFRSRGIPVAIGGPGVSAAPAKCRDDFDILFIGEAEKTWPAFLRDWQTGSYRSEYRQIEKLDLADSPIPRWDSIVSDIPKYAMGCVQTTRGCPFDCEFCDVIYLFGRRSRHKPIEKVLKEVEILQQLGMEGILFCDDEFIGEPRYTKELLRALIPLNNSFPRPLHFTTQLTMNLSKDAELLELMADANFRQLFIGIETPNKEALKETGKYHNMRQDLVADVHKIHSYGIAVRAGLIVGFDHDGLDIFDIQYDFIQRTCTPSVSVNLLRAAYGTRLWRRLRQEGRVTRIGQKIAKGRVRGNTNILPKLMTRLELLTGYGDLLERIDTWENFSSRVRGFVSLVRRRPQVNNVLPTSEEMSRLSSDLNLGPEDSKIVQETIDYVDRHAPWMRNTVKELIIRQASYLRMRLSEQVRQQIALEVDGSIVLEPDTRPVLIPKPFRDAFKRMFSHVYARVYSNLADQSQIPEALTEVFVDFLVRWGDSFTQLEEYHFVFFEELCDRTCAMFNRQAPQDFRPTTAGDVPLENVRRTRLGEDILTSVEQELQKLATSS